jgi:glutamate:GABA antiporter
MRRIDSLFLATGGPHAMAQHNGSSQLRRSLGFWDVVMFLTTACINLQWVATAAGAGAAAVTFWILAFATMAVPLGLCVVELSSRYPQEGGIYVWSKHAFGDGAAFMSGWTYWTSNLPYFPGVLYFAAANVLYCGGAGWRRLSDSSLYFLLASLLGLGLATWLNLIGLDIGKWLNNVGAVSRWLAALVLLGMGALAWHRFGSATTFTPATLLPGTRLKDLIFLSTIAFALTGLEAASFMGEEIRDTRRTLPRAILLTAPLVSLIYIVGTMSVLVTLPASEVSSLQGIMAATASAAHRLGLDGVARVAAFLITASALGSVGAWLGSTARLPFVAGIDHVLPKGFGRIHPRWHTPHVSLLVSAGVAVVCVVLSQAGTTVRGAYDILVSMSVISFLIPFLFLFASMIRLQNEPAGPEVRRVPGGRLGAWVFAGIGFLTTSVAIVLAFVPSPEEPHPLLAFAKLVVLTLILVGSGALLYALGKRRARRAS